jgi:hypothetical protein
MWYWLTAQPQPVQRLDEVKRICIITLQEEIETFRKELYVAKEERRMVAAFKLAKQGEYETLLSTMENSSGWPSILLRLTRRQHPHSEGLLSGNLNGNAIFPFERSAERAIEQDY